MPEVLKPEVKPRIDHSICPICGRNRAEVAASAGPNSGYQVYLGKKGRGRASCVECGKEAMRIRDERSNLKFVQSRISADELIHSKMGRCRELSAAVSRLEKKVADQQNRLRQLSEMGFWSRLSFVLFG